MNGPLPRSTAFLYIDALQCVRQRDFPLDGDTPYLLVFAGQRDQHATSDVMRVTSAHWQDSLRSGDTLHPRTWIHHEVLHDTVLMIALIEQNWRLDLHDESLDALRESMQARWAHIARGSNATEAMTLAAHHAFRKQITALLRNDKLIQVRHLPAPHVGTLPALSFTGHGALYRAGFRLQAV